MEGVLQARVPQPLSWITSNQLSDDFQCCISALQTLKLTEQENLERYVTGIILASPQGRAQAVISCGANKAGH